MGHSLLDEVKKLVHLQLIITVLFAFNCHLFSQEASVTDLQGHFLKEMDRAGFIGMQLGFVKANGTMWTGSFGVQNYSTGIPVNDSTLFMIASCSKPVTAIAVLKLYDEGRLDLDADINDYLAFEIRNPFYEDDFITTRMLLAHTACLKDDWDVLDPLYTLDEGGDSPLKLGDFVKSYFSVAGANYQRDKNFINEQPGEYWEYCNMGYALLGLIVEQVSGMSFSEFIQDSIFMPIGMHDSYWFLTHIPHENIARPHTLPEKRSNSDTIKVLKHYGFPDFPDGQLRTTVTDYLKFVNLILNDGVLDGRQFIRKDIIQLFHQVQFPKTHKYQAVAWNYDEFENWLYYLLMRRLPSHTGGDPGVATVVSYDPEQKIAAVVFTNSPPTTFQGGKILYLDLIKRLLKEARD